MVESGYIRLLFPYQHIYLLSFKIWTEIKLFWKGISKWHVPFRSALISFVFSWLTTGNYLSIKKKSQVNTLESVYLNQIAFHLGFFMEQGTIWLTLFLNLFIFASLKPEQQFVNQLKVIVLFTLQMRKVRAMFKWFESILMCCLLSTFYKSVNFRELNSFLTLKNVHILDLCGWYIGPNW